jgi:hypothetical protein
VKPRGATVRHNHGTVAPGDPLVGCAEEVTLVQHALDTMSPGARQSFSLTSDNRRGQAIFLSRLLLAESCRDTSPLRYSSV